MMSRHKGMLDEDGNLVLTDNLYEWAQWFEHNPEKCVIDYTKLNGYEVSTIFLALDFGSEDNPIWFETIVFEPPREGQLDHRGQPEHRGPECYQKRYATRERACAGHDDALAWLRSRLNKKP